MVGIVTDRDIVIRNVASGTDPHTIPVKNVMTTGITTATPEMTADEVSDLMSRQQVRRLPVVENNRLVGMVSLGDIAVNNQFNFEASEALAEISKPAKPEQLNK